MGCLLWRPGDETATIIDMRSTTDQLAARDVTMLPLCSMRLEFWPPTFVALPTGTRGLFAVRSGTVEGPRLSGRVLPGSADWVTVCTASIARVDVRAVIETDEGALVQMTSTGRAVLGGDVDRLLAGEEISAETTYIRTSPLFETSDPRYTFLNGLVNVAWCDLAMSHVDYRIYAVS